MKTNKKRPLPKAAEPFKFKKGVSGNPEGSRAHNPAIRALKKLTIEIYREVIELAMTSNLAALKEVAEHPDTPAVQVGVAVALMKAIREGDYGVIERIAERIVGKIPDELNVNSKNFNANLNARIDQTKLKAALAKLEDDV
jgi:hypothetical protein